MQFEELIYDGVNIDVVQSSLDDLGGCNLSFSFEQARDQIVGIATMSAKGKKYAAIDYGGCAGEIFKSLVSKLKMQVDGYDFKHLVIRSGCH